MREDGPTLPSLHSYASGEGEEAGGSPTWPIDRGHSHPASTNYVVPLMLGASLVLNVVLFIGLLSVLIFGWSSLPSEGGSPVRSASVASTPTSRGRSPAALLTPTPTATGWLQVSPGTVQLGCNANQQTQFAVLENTGSAPVQWQVTFSQPANQAGVNVNPSQGTINPGGSIPVQIQNQTNAHGMQGITVQKGSILFNPTTPDAGPAANLAYTTAGC